METAFDHIAKDYDASFTNTAIGRLQRQQVWSYIGHAYKDGFPENVLELNCGTGEDAIFFAKHGSKVVATDVSEEMIAETKTKIADHHLEHAVGTHRIDITGFHPEVFEGKFDLVFSNFGGLNCVDADHLTRLFKNVAAVLNPGARMILVLMPRFCAWETVYYLSKLNVDKAFRRRKTKAQSASLGGSDIDIWYYDPSQVLEMSSEYFKPVHVQPIGIAVPPSYFKNSFLGRENALKKLAAAERKLNKFRSLSRMADHYLIDLELK